MSKKRRTTKSNTAPSLAPTSRDQAESEAGARARETDGQLEKRPPGRFPIVGIGASAGGLAAFETFFSGMPADADPGMAFVLVQHLAPDHKSILSDLVRRYTRMQVYEVEDGIEVQPNCTYIIPPGRDMALLNGTLQLLEPGAPRGMRLPIDFFFRSLAHEQREQAICVVLSGTGSDGTLGVRAIKGEGGMVMVQSPESTEYDGMPQSVIATGLADYVLRPAEMAARIVAFAAHAFGPGPRLAGPQAPESGDTLKKISVVLRDQTGHDFSQYKQNTLVRRVERRMAVHQIEQMQEYLLYLRQTPAEADSLFRDLLIGVTSFFRDPDAFAVLESQVIPKIFANKPAGAPVRVWVCGCATGEEAYSIAILLQEHIDTLEHSFKVQVFATDIDARAVEQARAGIYSASIAADVSPERLERFFTREPGSDVYRIQRVIRDLLVFSEHDVIKDPPFSRLDLVTCRNLLIYLNAELQQRLIPLFHYALDPQGFLVLGTSETVGEFGTLFTALDRKQRIFQQQQDLAGVTHPSQIGSPVPPSTDVSAAPTTAVNTARPQGSVRPREVAERTLLAHYAQAAVLVNGRGDVVYIHGRTGKFLEPAAGDAGMNILSMAREGLRPALASALRKAVTQQEPVSITGLKVRTNGDSIRASLSLRRADGPTGSPQPDLFLVILEAEPTAPPALDAEAPDPPGDADEPAVESHQRIAALEQELRTKEEYLQSTIEEMETANEELKSTNEEMQSVNEELQSTNEELETSKEELQSVNEELATVNSELQTKVADLSRANNDMNNLLAGTGVGTLFVDHQLRIARFTPATAEVINLIQSDVGRPVAHIVSNLVGYDRLVEDVKEVLDTLSSREIEVQTRTGDWYLLRIQPYRTLENVIDGAVITFTNVTKHKRIETSWLNAKDLADGIVATVREPLLVLDEDLRILQANAAFYRTFGMSKEETVGHLLIDLGDGQWNIPQLRQLLREILLENTSFEDFEVVHDFDGIGRRTMQLNARRICFDGNEGERILLAIEDKTDGADAPAPVETAGRKTDGVDRGNGS
ncbi:MAG: chemotaxis protein CheB [Polyangia bacterium]